MTSRPRACHRGFTLVELLVVITIIGILAGLALVGIQRAVVSTQNAAMKVEISQIAQALDLYKQQFGAYPPDCNEIVFPANSDREDAFNLHLRKKFSNRKTSGTSADIPIDGTNITRLIEAGVVSPFGTAASDYKLHQLDPTETYVLFLMGFSSDIENPITGTGDRTPLFEFDETRLVDPDGDGWWSYKPKYSDSEIVYFNAKSYDNFSTTPATYAFDNSEEVAEVNFNNITNSLASGIARPYGRVAATGSFEWAEKDKFQLICAGLDGDFGGYYVTDPSVAETNDAVKIYPSGLVETTGSVLYKLEDLDNIVNFGEAATLDSDTDL